MRELSKACMVSALLLWLAGCQLSPSQRLPAPPIAKLYPDEYVGDPVRGARAPAIAWQDFFADARLATLIGLALRRNRDLAAAVAQVAEARALYGVQRAEQMPAVAVEASATRSHSNSTAPGSGAAFATAPFGGERYFVGAGLAAFELDFWGRVRNLSGAALAQYLASAQAARAFRLALMRDVALAYLSMLEALERMELAQATLDSRREGLRIAQRRLEAGVTSALDYHQAEALMRQAETELAALRTSKAQSENLLNLLVGGPIMQSLPAALPLAEQTQTTALAAGLPAELLLARPDILAAEQRLRAARFNIAAARAALLPAITLTGSYGFASSDLDALVADGTNSWSIGPSIDLPLFDFGRRRANLDTARARDRIALASYERAIQGAFREVADALAGRRYLAEQLSAQQRAAAAQRQLAEFARIRYREGVVSYLEVLDAERSLFSAEQALLQLRRAVAANQVELYVALGGGMHESDPTEQ